jgi:hypothetical protein
VVVRTTTTPHRRGWRGACGPRITYLSDTRRILGFARAHGLGLLSIWAIQRDNGGCPGTIDSDTCSGIKQPAWAFSHLLERFTH